MTGLCLIAGLLMAPLGETVLLGWTHSVEKTRWEEVWREEKGQMRLTEARIRTMGAGMEPPPGARLVEGAWHYVPALPPQPSVLLTHSPHVPSYTICADGRCQAVESWLPGLPQEALLELMPCSRLGRNGSAVKPLPRRLGRCGRLSRRKAHCAARGRHSPRRAGKGRSRNTRQ